MLKNLGGRYACFYAKSLHFRPYLFSAQAAAASGEKNFTGGDFVFIGIFLQLVAQLARQQNCANLAFERNFRLACIYGLKRDAVSYTHLDVYKRQIQGACCRAHGKVRR